VDLPFDRRRVRDSRRGGSRTDCSFQKEDLTHP